MSTISKWIAVLLILPVVSLTACGDGDGGSSGGAIEGANLQINLTDAPGDYLSVLVKITGIYAIVGESDPLPLEFADFTSPAIVDQTGDSVTVDLIRLSEEDPIEFAFGELPEGDLNQIRLIVTEASLTAFEDVVGLDGNDDGLIEHVEAAFPVKVPSGSQTGIKLNPQDVDITTRALTALTLDFDADKSIVQLGGGGGGRDFDFILKPVIFILEAVGTTPVDTETVSVGLNFPTAVNAVEDVGGGSIIGEDNLLVANAGISGVLRNTVVAVDIYDTLPVIAPTLTPFASSADVFDGEPLVNSPSGIAQFLGLVWISNAASATALYNAGTIAELYTSGDFRTIYIGNAPPTESLAGLVETSGVEFGGFAPNGSLSGVDRIIFQTNENGSLTAITIGDGLIFDILEAGTFDRPTDLAFVPSATPLEAGDPEGTSIGTLFITDAGANLIGVVSLRTTGGAVGESSTRVAGNLDTTLSFPFLSEPVGIAFSQGSNRLYVANRGNGSIIAFDPVGTEIETFDTGFGAKALNGIDVVSGETQDMVFFTNTAGNDDPSTDNPDDGGLSTLEMLIVPLT